MNKNERLFYLLKFANKEQSLEILRRKLSDNSESDLFKKINIFYKFASNSRLSIF
jgi:hypothetical protein